MDVQEHICAEVIFLSFLISRDLHFTCPQHYSLKYCWWWKLNPNILCLSLYI